MPKSRSELPRRDGKISAVQSFLPRSPPCGKISSVDLPPVGRGVRYAPLSGRCGVVSETEPPAWAPSMVAEAGFCDRNLEFAGSRHLFRENFGAIGEGVRFFWTRVKATCGSQNFVCTDMCEWKGRESMADVLFIRGISWDEPGHGFWWGISLIDFRLMFEIVGRPWYRWRVRAHLYASPPKEYKKWEWIGMQTIFDSSKVLPQNKFEFKIFFEFDC